MQLSDRYGRTRIIGIGFLGLAFDDSVVILVSKYAQLFPGGYWFLLIGSVLSGVLGGALTRETIIVSLSLRSFAGVVAVLVAMNAYIADCSAPDQRSVAGVHFG
jgi:MFS family permease